MKQIANGFTLLNLVFGCLAIVAALEPGLSSTTDSDGINTFIILPEKIYLASVFIACAAIIDFFDGFVARLLNAASPLGKELDSLADVVSFGVAPGMIALQFLKISFAKNEAGLDTNTLWLLPALLIPVAGAMRLARFNIDQSHTPYFRGVPIPAVGILIASFPLIYWYCNSLKVNTILTSVTFWYILIFAVSFLMVCSKPMYSLKFKSFSISKQWPLVLLAIIAILGGLFLGWLTVPVVFILYVLLSLATIKKEPTAE